MLTKSDLEAISKIVKTELKTGLSGSEARLMKELKKVDKKLDLTINFFDKDTLSLRKRVNRVEDELELAPLQS